MLTNKRNEFYAAAVLVTPMAAIFCLIFVYPTIQMIVLSFTNSPLIGWGDWVGFDNYVRQLTSPLFGLAALNTVYFVVLTALPGTILALLIAIGINRQKGWIQGFVLACFFLPSVLPVSVVTQTWNWMANLQYGILQPVFEIFTGGHPLAVFKQQATFMPMIAAITVWWTIGFNVLLFIAGLRNVSVDIYEAASLDNAGRWRVFSSITWPLIWPVTALVLTLQLIAQLKIFTQVYLLGASNATAGETQTVLMKLVYDLAFAQNKGGEGASVATLLFLLIIAVSILQVKFLGARAKK
jgi:multiple sugar transport system permease protein